MAGQMTPQELRDFITSTVNAAVQNLNLPPGPPGESGPQGPPGPATSAENGTTRWNPGDLGFFDPNYDNKSISNGSALEHTGKETYFRDVYLFIERA